MNRSKSPWVFFVCLALCLFSAGSSFAERSLSRSKLERELKHLRESLHEAHRELAIKADRIEELSKELERMSHEKAPSSDEGKSSAKKTAKKMPLPEGVTSSGEKPKQVVMKEAAGEEERTEVKKKTKRAPEVAREASITIYYDQNSAVNFEGRDRVLQFVEKQSEENPEASFSVKAFANDSEYAETDRDIANNRARFLTDYLVIRGASRDAFSDVAGEISEDPGRKGRRAVVLVRAGK